MARLVTAGTALRDTNTTLDGPDGRLSGVIAPTFETTIVRSGTTSWKCTGSGTSTSQVLFDIATLTTPTFGRTYFVRGYFRWPTSNALVAGDKVILISDNSAGHTSICSCKIATVSGTDYTFALYNDNGVVQIGSASGTYTGGTWYRFEMSCSVAGSGTTMSCELRIDGVSIASGSALATNATAAPAQFYLGRPAVGGGTPTPIIYLADVAVNDDQGANQNTWPGSGKVVLLLPISDSAIGTGWTLGTGTAISGNSGSTALKNTPPIGVADLTAGSDTKQIRNATSNASVSYDANLTSYTTAGILPGDIITVLRPFVITAAPVSTSAKQGLFGLASNPAIATIALAAAGTSGAFWSGTAGGTHPTGWKVSYGTMTYNPSVTLGTSPVARITQVTSSTRIAVVESMGMYVEYIPAASDPPTLDRRRTSRRGVRTVKV